MERRSNIATHDRGALPRLDVVVVVKLSSDVLLSERGEAGTSGSSIEHLVGNSEGGVGDWHCSEEGVRGDPGSRFHPCDCLGHKGRDLTGAWVGGCVPVGASNLGDGDWVGWKGSVDGLHLALEHGQVRSVEVDLKEVNLTVRALGHEGFEPRETRGTVGDTRGSE